jgi:outer membrane receptor protein involved in Fe transport
MIERRSFGLFLIFAAALLSASAGAAESLRGRVVDGAGRSLAQVEIEVSVAGGRFVVARAATDAEGSFDFAGLPEGELVVAARRPSGEAAVVLVEEADRAREVVINLDQALPQVAFEVLVFGALPRTAASSSFFREGEFAGRAIEEPGDVLRVVPGLVVAQHAGGGKSDQYLIRGFDADHGTDLALSFAGIPVNLVSHAHGQGYADLGFIIPETLETIDVYRGPYFVEFGNLATAGATVLRLREELEGSFVKIQSGSFATGRILLGLSPRLSWTRGFLAIEERFSNGPFENPQHFHRFNLATRWSFDFASRQKLSLLFTANESRWSASGQVPLREVEAGRLDRFGAIDPSEGGETSRFNLSLSHQKLGESRAVNSQFYAVAYDLDLFSNFSFFARDPVRGDGIAQRDERIVAGGHLRWDDWLDLGGFFLPVTAGVDYRQDWAEVGLFNQQRRQVFETVSQSQINERNLGLYLQGELRLHPRLKALLGLRHDRFRFGVNERAESRSFTGPKASLIFSPRGEPGPQVFLNYGRGFHSNDARSVVADPSGVALAGADGYEVGYRQVFSDRLEISLAYWLLDLEGELVWVGDEGTTEISGPTRRQGPELEARLKLGDKLWLDGAVFYSRGRYRGSDEAIARAPRLVASGGVTFESSFGLSGNLRLRHVGKHPLVEDGSVEASGYTAAELYLRYGLSQRWEAVVSVENLFDADIKEAQTYFASRLSFETTPVADNHFTPGNPFTLRLGLQYRF